MENYTKMADYIREIMKIHDCELTPEQFNCLVGCLCIYPDNLKQTTDGSRIS